MQAGVASRQHKVLLTDHMRHDVTPAGLNQLVAPAGATSCITCGLNQQQGLTKVGIAVGAHARPWLHLLANPVHIADATVRDTRADPLATRQDHTPCCRCHAPALASYRHCVTGTLQSHFSSCCSKEVRRRACLERRESG